MDHANVSKSNINHRARCAHCDNPKYNRYRLDAQMLRVLMWFVANPQWHAPASKAVPREALRVKNYALLRHWGLLQAGERRDMWRATPLAAKFVSGGARLWSHIITSKNGLEGFTGRLVDITDAMGREVTTEELESGWVK